MIKWTGLAPWEFEFPSPVADTDRVGGELAEGPEEGGGPPAAAGSSGHPGGDGETGPEAGEGDVGGCEVR